MQLYSSVFPNRSWHLKGQFSPNGASHVLGKPSSIIWHADQYELGQGFIGRLKLSKCFLGRHNPTEKIFIDSPSEFKILMVQFTLKLNN